MVLEVATIDVKPGSEAAFATAYQSVSDEVRTTPGCQWMRMTKGIESPSRFVLVVEWDSVEAHVKNFRSTDRFARWRAAITPYFAAPPLVEHFTDVPASAG